MVETYQKMIDRLKMGRIFLKKHILDNEILAKYKKETESNGMTWELVPVGMHSRYVAEKIRKRLKDTSSPSFAASPHISHSRNGIPYYLKPNSHAIFCINRTLRPTCWHKQTHSDPMTSTACPWHH